MHLTLTPARRSPVIQTTHFMWTARLLRPLAKDSNYQHLLFTSAAWQNRLYLKTEHTCVQFRVKDAWTRPDSQTVRWTDGGEVQTVGVLTVGLGATFWSVGGSKMSLMYMWQHMGHMDEYMATVRLRQSYIVNRCFNTFFVEVQPPQLNIWEEWQHLTNIRSGRSFEMENRWEKNI